MTKSDFHSQLNNSLPPVYIGVPQWQHSRWPGDWFNDAGARKNALGYYAKQMNSVEGNTTFYALPSPDTVARWIEQTPQAFRFTFKVHQTITHSGAPDPNHPDIEKQLSLLAPLKERLGMLMLQLPASTGPDSLQAISAMLQQFPADIPLGVEVRHPAFFDKGGAEQQFNRMLMEQKVNRVIMDTRGLFAGPSDSELTTEVRMKKPRLPVNVIATSTAPVVRFVGGNDDAANTRCLQPWIGKCHEWRLEGRTPYMFFHKPENGDAPWLAAEFIDSYNACYPDAALPALTFAPPPAEQTSLF
ncbi:MAG: hypothetical protein CL587_17940 [Alteromonadaceae bacterium]|nr:hypothetical protein [Alteromonadaceae bacterium]MEC7692425.1 DUF72 domain-containing protein [Pseudomonadota bacterium]